MIDKGKKLHIMGDIHGKFGPYTQTVNRLNKRGCSTLQLGDFGIGFPQCTWKDSRLNDLSRNAAFRGNHDNPAHARESELFLPDFGYIAEAKLFWFSGAFSIDKDWRTEDVDWWRDEQLSYSQMEDATRLYEECKPEIVVSHDGPYEAVREMFPALGLSRYEKNPTTSCLQNMFEIHHPKKWFFGHHHQDIKMQIFPPGTVFTCVGIDQSVEVLIDGWDGKFR